MERWIGSRSARGILALGAGLLMLVAALTKFRAGAEETKDALPKTSETAKPKREALRYGGKNFDQWRVEMETELKPEVRADGMTAMAAFGANGYGAEATRTIVDLMAGYDLETPFAKDKLVVDAALQAIGKIGEPSLPVLWKSVLGDKKRSRLFAIKCFHDLMYFGDYRTDWHPPVPDLLKAARNDNVEVRTTALKFLAKVKHKPKNGLPVLLECLKDKDSDVREEAIDRLDEMRPGAREVMPALRTAIADSEPRVRYRALFMAEHYGAHANPLIPELMRRLEKPDSLARSNPSFFADEFVALMKTLAAIGPDAKEALPKLRKLREEKNAEERVHDPYSSPDARTYREIIDQAIKKIEGK